MESWLFKRQNNVDYGNGVDYDAGWWFSTAGTIARYAITGAILVAVFVLIGGGYYHARYRLKKHQEPLAYHRWLVSNHTRMRYGMPPIHPRGMPVHPRAYAGYTNNAPAEQWNMNNWNYPPPPPAYNTAPQQESDHPPEYYHPPTSSTYGAKGQAEASVHLAPPQEAELGSAYMLPHEPPLSHLPPAYPAHR